MAVELLHGQQRKELLIVLRRVEHLPTIIAPSDHMIQTTRNFSAPLSGPWTRIPTRRLIGPQPTSLQGFCISMLSLEHQDFDYDRVDVCIRMIQSEVVQNRKSQA